SPTRRSADLRNSSRGTCRPITAKHTVIGVESTRPTGPQSHVQNTAEMINAIGDTPVFAPYTQGSTKFDAIASNTINKAIVISGMNQLLEIANESSTGKRAPTHGPT